jgi:hypothetical protein
MANTGKSQIVERPSLSFEFQLQSTHEIEPKSGNTLSSADDALFFSPSFRTKRSFRGNSAGASSVTPRTSFPANPIQLFFRCFNSNAVPRRSLPTVPDHRKLVGPVGLEPTTKGFTSAPPFPEGVDYLFTPRGVRDALACY